MKAAVVEDFARPPRYRDFDPPVPGAGERRVSVHAAALSQLVRAQSAGRHYTRGTPPFVPGADGVGRLDDGRRVYFVFPRAPFGAMAEQSVVRAEYMVAVPDEVDDVTAAAIANPGMSSWAALSHRAALVDGETVLIQGATGASGQLAIRIARHLGAGHIVATGRSAAAEAALRRLGADEYIALEDQPESLSERFAELVSRGVDVVLDYLWGPPALALMQAFTGHGPAASPPVRYVNIGSLAGADIALPAGLLRSSGIRLMGSGIGSVAHTDLVASIGGVLSAVETAGLKIATETAPLAEVEKVWGAAREARLVFVP
ncbi:quinone oxidoreductase family protein [Salinisphaera hydrothermalis]|uniref:quinone oxidoreductase family protein n=1 Tax=Salinisphaera hydrothermalis TaxID=563188 RepID=UPI0033428626